MCVNNDFTFDVIVNPLPGFFMPVITPSKVKLSFEEKREFGSLEKDIERLGRKKKSIEASFMQEGITQEQVKEKSEELYKVISSLEEKEERWFEISLKLEG
jgi:ATP-binding cassette subfamily F protein uup